MLLKIVKKLTLKTIKNSVNTACTGWSYQPKLPQQVLALKKQKSK